MVNVLLKTAVLAEIYEGFLPNSLLRTFFRDSSVDKFLRNYPQFVRFEKGIIAKSCSKRQVLKRIAISLRKIGFARKQLAFLSFLPWVVFAGISGSVAYMNAREEDDIDIFLVVQKNRLWITRSVEQMYLRVRGIRRTYGQDDIRDRICVNYAVSEDRINFGGSGKEKYFTALELAYLIPLAKRDTSYKKILLSKNPWVLSFFDKVASKNLASKILPRIPVVSLFVDDVDWILWKFQLCYMCLLRHPIEQATVQRNIMAFYDQSTWKIRAKELGKALQRYYM